MTINTPKDYFTLKIPYHLLRHSKYNQHALLFVHKTNAQKVRCHPIFKNKFLYNIYEGEDL